MILAFIIAALATYGLVWVVGAVVAIALLSSNAKDGTPALIAMVVAGVVGILAAFFLGGPVALLGAAIGAGLHYFQRRGK